jgi:hypothetical protein
LSSERKWVLCQNELRKNYIWIMEY